MMRSLESIAVCFGGIVKILRLQNKELERQGHAKKRLEDTLRFVNYFDNFNTDIGQTIEDAAKDLMSNANSTAKFHAVLGFYLM